MSSALGERPLHPGPPERGPRAVDVKQEPQRVNLLAEDRHLRVGETCIDLLDEHARRIGPAEREVPEYPREQRRAFESGAPFEHLPEGDRAARDPEVRHEARASIQVLHAAALRHQQHLFGDPACRRGTLKAPGVGDLKQGPDT